MKHLSLLCLIGTLISFSLYAQQTNLSQVDQWVYASERVILSDSVENQIFKEATDKKIPEKIMRKNLIYFRMLFNPSYSKTERLRIAQYILEIFRGYEDQFPVKVVMETKNILIHN